MPETTPLETALKILDRQACTVQQLRIHLEKAGFENQPVEDCLLHLKTRGYLNDRLYGEDRIRLLQNRCKSRQYVICDLERNGLTPALVEELLNQFYPAELELVVARKLLGKRFDKETSHLDPETGTAATTDVPIVQVEHCNTMSTRRAIKAAASLARAGFAEETIRRCFPSGLPAISST